MNKVKIKYKNICPITKNIAEIQEILKYGESKEIYNKFKKKFQELLKSNRCEDLKHAKDLCYIEKKVKKFKKFFYSKFKTQPFSLQIYWAKKFFKKESFSIIAPTGIGKTTFGIILACFIEGKTYYIVPTKILLNEIEKRFLNLNTNKKILTIKTAKDKKLLNEDFDILITTSQFIHKNFHLLPKNFNLVFIDDADSMIRQPKNIDKVLKLIGFNDNDINNALKIIDSKRKKEYEKIDSFKNNIDFKNKGQIIVASATLTPKTKRVNLFRELLNFEIGAPSTFLRNIEDLYEESPLEDLFEKSVDCIKKLGNGGFVFLTSDFSQEDLEKYIEYLKNNQINAISYKKFNKKNIDLFIKGDINVIVGFSNIRNPLTRGIDLPHVVRYTLFLGIPKFKINLKLNYSPARLLMILIAIKNFYENKIELRNDLSYLKKYSFLKEENVLENERIKQRIEQIKEKIEKIFNSKDFFEKIKNDPNLVIENINGEYYLSIPDPKGYIQASGRCSRLFPLGLTKGVSILLSENQKLFKNLLYKLIVLGYKIKFKDFKNVDIEKILKDVDKDREIVKKFFEGKEFEFTDPIKTSLIIVESPIKARTIANFFGRPLRRRYGNLWVYEISIGDRIINIVATLGHIVDLVRKVGYYGVEKNDYFLPIFQPIKICTKCFRNVEAEDKFCEVCKNKEFFDKTNIIEILQNLANEVQEVYISTDPDSEGEKIALDLYAYIYPYNKNLKRIELHEITKEEFLNRFKQPRKIKESLVCAQIVRRIADRWVGFSLSNDLQKKFRNLNLSAGRVQTPVLGWIIDRDLERKEKYYIIRFLLDDKKFVDFAFENKEDVKKIKENKNNINVLIKFKNIREIEKPPLPPFQTSDLLREAWNILKMDAVTTMKTAQDLFERGLITYHRTDSYYTSSVGIDIAEEFLIKNNKENLFKPRNWGKQGTHECIRPTKPLTVDEIIEQNILNQEEILSKKHLSLYGLILNRFISSQASNAKIKKAKVLIEISGPNMKFKKIQDYIIDIIDKGYLEFFTDVYPFKLNEGSYNIKDLIINRFSKVPPYTNATIIEEMKKKKLGRPSTYSTIIETLFSRKYTISRKGFIIPTSLGKKIYNYLNAKYKDFISEKFTREIEDKMDKIEKNKIDYQNVLLELFNKLFIIKK